MKDISQHNNKQQGRGKGPSGKKACKTNGRLTPFGLDTTKTLVRVAEELSKFVGINPRCVTKKMPENISPTVFKDTLKVFENAEERCAEANNFWFGDQIDLNLRNPVDIDEVAGNLAIPGLDASDIRYVLKEASRQINRIIDVDFKKSDNIYLGPGAACVCPTLDGKIVRTKSRIFKLAESKEGCGWLRPNPKYKSSLFFEDDIASYIDENLGQQCHVDLIQQVPKSNEKNRPIGIGCVIGIASQHVVGDYIRKCLKRHGVDLNRLSLEHKMHAWEGSKYNNISTIDFSSASDTISRSLVHLLFNNTKSSDRVKELFRLMDSCRSVAYVTLDENGSLPVNPFTGTVNPIVKSVVYDKFAPMGNCFTFELESLIFTVLGRALEKRIMFRRFLQLKPTKYDSLYRLATSFGDDLCLFVGELTNSELRWLCYILDLLGLKVNFEKSFVSGSFRESCGADFDGGNFVRGFYFQKPRLDITDYIRMVNFFHMYFRVPLEKILSMDPECRRIFYDYKLGNYCVAPPTAGGVLDTLLIIPQTFIVTDTLPPTGKYLAIAEVKNYERGPMYGHPYYRCTHKQLQVRIQDLLVPAIQGTLYSILDSDLDCGQPFRTSEPFAFIDANGDMHVNNIHEPIVWDPGITLYQRVSGQRFAKNFWERQPRLQLDYSCCSKIGG